jgi:hypothetical protein
MSGLLLATVATTRFSIARCDGRSPVPYTKLHPLLEEFTPEASEDRLYNLVSDSLFFIPQ